MKTKLWLSEQSWNLVASHTHSLSHSLTQRQMYSLGCARSPPVQPKKVLYWFLVIELYHMVSL